MVDATSIHGITIDPPPSFAPNPAPNGDTVDGISLFMNPASNSLSWRNSHLSYGASRLTVNVPLLNGQERCIWNPNNYIGPDGMRTDGLVQYPVNGNFDFGAKICIAGPSSCRYIVRWRTGMKLDPSRPNIYTIDPADLATTSVVVAADVFWWPGAANQEFVHHANAFDIGVAVSSTMTSEFVVTVQADWVPTGGIDTPAVLGASAGLPAGYITQSRIWRNRDL